MGVPSFFQWLTNKYPGIVFWDEKQVVDNFYFDFNGVIHTACRKILDSKLESYVDIEGQMIDAIIKYSGAGHPEQPSLLPISRIEGLEGHVETLYRYMYSSLTGKYLLSS